MRSSLAFALVLLVACGGSGATSKPVETSRGRGFEIDCIDDKRFCEREAKRVCSGKTAVVIGNAEEKPETGPNADHWMYRITVVCR